ncbi:LysR family transcriptional regulator [Thalassospira sp.]|uniref:LysR family transcriptional regulator n=1 Tax=Thalassospira sp. TaxID=1912094 RepID=UPI002732B9E1|nr:LysR family transcriptional regulator [Thalassospira sp.]MDP2697061.1 LysR substrate-binding domain-containing protein [Thalassospira sp.]
MLSSLNIRHMRAFVAIADHGSFSAAAHYLGLTPPALTATIRQFEDVTGAALFDRTTRTVSLTATGERFLPVARRLIGDFDEALNDLDALSKGIGGTITIAAAPSVLTRILPAVISRFVADHPDARLRLDERNAGEVHEAVARNEADFGLAGEWQAMADIRFSPLFSDRFGVLCRADHRFAVRESLHWAELSGENFVGLGPESGTGVVMAQPGLLGEADSGVDTGIGADKPGQASGAARAVSVLPRPVVETSNTLTLAAMVAEGVGITILPELAARLPDMSGAGGLCFVPLQGPERRRQIGVITRHSKSLSPVARIFLAMVIEQAPHLHLPAALDWYPLPDDLAR